MNTDANTTPGAVTMPSGVIFSDIVASDFFTCALSTTGTVYCWGANYSGNLGNSTTVDSTTPVAITMPDGVTFKAITVGAGHACALTTTGIGYCWGYNYHGQLGNGTTIANPVGSTTPVAVTMPDGVSSFTAISASRNATCALTLTDTAYCWGANNGGQLGNGTTVDSTTPVAVTMPTDVLFKALSNNSGSGMSPLCVDDDGHGVLLGMELQWGARQRHDKC